VAHAPEPVRLRSDVAGVVLVAGTFDTKGAELGYIRDRLRAGGVAVQTVDLSTSGKPSAAHVPPHHVAGFHPGGTGAVFTGDRGRSVKAMAEAFAIWIEQHPGIGGIISAAGSGGTTLATPAMQKLPIGVPKIMVSTVASGDVGACFGPADIITIYSVADVQGLNSITRWVLGNAAAAMAGMVAAAREAEPLAATERPALGLTMFGVTTPGRAADHRPAGGSLPMPSTPPVPAVAPWRSSPTAASSPRRWISPPPK
jgi:uncharacterized protein (UPF0261 family)